MLSYFFLFKDTSKKPKDNLLWQHIKSLTLGMHINQLDHCELHVSLREYPSTICCIEVYAIGKDLCTISQTRKINNAREQQSGIIII